MPRYRAPRAPKPPKPPKQPKIPRPKTRDLRIILKGLITTDIGQRTNSLLYALQWYEQAVHYITFKQKGVLTPDQRKSLDRVHKSRLQGQGTSFAGEKEQAYRTAIRILEKLMEKILKPPKIDKFYQILDRRQPKLEKKTEKWEEKFGETMDMLQKSLKPENLAGKPIEIKVGPVQEVVQKDAELSQITIRPDILKLLHRRRYREGLLVAVMEGVPYQEPGEEQEKKLCVIEELAKLSAMEKELNTANEWTGRWMIRPSNQYKAVLTMMRNLTTYAKGPDAPKRLAKVAAAEKVVDPNAPPKPKRTGFGPKSTAPKLMDQFVIGSDIANVFQRLMDGQKHQKAELQKMISAKLDGRLQVINMYGKRRGGAWQVHQSGTEVWMTMVSQPAPSNP